MLDYATIGSFSVRIYGGDWITKQVKNRNKNGEMKMNNYGKYRTLNKIRYSVAVLVIVGILLLIKSCAGG